MQFDLIIDFMLVAAIYGLGVSLVILLFQKTPVYNKCLLGISLFSYAWFCLVTALVHSHLILKVPHLFRVVTPLTYLVAPTSYLYVRSTINGETRPQKYDWIHFIPFAFLSLELLPFYLKSAAYKQQVISYYLLHSEESFNLHEGYLEKHVHFILRTILALVYVYLQRHIIADFLDAAPSKIKSQYEKLTNWLKLYSLLILFTYTLVLVVSLVNLFFKLPGLIPTFIMSVHLSIITLILISKPKIMFGFATEFVTVHKSALKSSIPPEKPDKQTERKQCIDNLLQHQEKYLIKGYSLVDMATELEISPHLLSITINHEYRLSFTDLVNKYRIEYIIKHMDEQKLANYTFEGLAANAGFNSRTTFYRAFIKVTGQTPTAYFKTKHSVPN